MSVSMYFLNGFPTVTASRVNYVQIGHLFFEHFLLPVTSDVVELLLARICLKLGGGLGRKVTIVVSFLHAGFVGEYNGRVVSLYGRQTFCRYLVFLIRLRNLITLFHCFKTSLFGNALLGCVIISLL